MNEVLNKRMERTSANSLTIGIQKYICQWKQGSCFVDTLWTSYKTHYLSDSLENLRTNIKSLKKLFERDFSEK